MPSLGLPLYKRVRWGTDQPAHGRLETDEPANGGASNLYVHIAASDVAISGGAAQIQVRDAGNVWTDVGFFAGNQSIPVSFPGGVDSNITKVGGVAITLGQKVMASSLPVAIASDQSPVNVQQRGVASALNSSTALLGAGGVFTGTFEDVLHYGAVVITAFSDVGLAFNGLQFEWSSDGANVDVTDSTNLAFAGVGEYRVAQIRGRYFRVKYTNGGVAQGVFRLNTTYKYVAEVPAPLGAVQLLDQAGVHKAIIDSFGDATPVQDRLLTETMLRFYNGATYDRARGDITNGLDVDVTRSALPSGAATEATLATRLAEATFTARINTQGQKAMAASTPVVIASDQTAVPISAVTLPLPTGAATEATLAAMSGKLPAALGQTTMAGSLSVVISSNQSTIPVVETHADLVAAAPTGSAVGVASASLVAANGARKGLVLTVTTAGRRVSFGLDGNPAVLDSGITLYGPGGVWQMDKETFTNGEVRAIADVAATNVAVQELT